MLQQRNCQNIKLKYWFFATVSHILHDCFILYPSQPTGEAQIKVERKEYTTFQKPFRERAKVDHLVDLAAENVKMNKQKILQEMEKAAQRRNQRNIQH